MFYEGSLQEGISTAVGQQKLVFCFVTNENEESQRWENEFLQDGSLQDVIAKRAVALRLIAGSEEAGYLAQIFPLPQTPTIVIMKHGELKEYISAGTTKEDFLRRVQSSFNIPSPPSQPPSSATSQPTPSNPISHSFSTAAIASSAQAGIPTVASSPPTIEQSDNVRRVLQDRAAKQQADKRLAEQNKKAADELAEQQKQAELVKKKKQQASDEVKRVRQRIQDDKEQRRQAARERELLRQGTSPWLESSSSPVAVNNNSAIKNTHKRQPSHPSSTSTRTSEHTSIQVRLFDGSTIRSRFRTASPMRHVRDWVDEARTDGSMPYSLKQLLTPLPNRSIDDTEDEKSLGEIGLAPSSTIVLVPIRPKYVSAYTHSSPMAIFSRLVSLPFGLLTWLLGLLGLGGGGSRGSSGGDGDGDSYEMTSERHSSVSAQTKERDRRIAGFENPDDGRRDHQLYNGNSLNFEPRPDEDEGK
ncbi:hypothetical protein E4U40_003123 [Claviceps sp. LM458 group G5]|nr:hypothetical protein E4U40_003123 [Claviceps sp. LM458 group G5]